MKLLTNLKELDKAIESIAKRGAKLDDDIQLCALSAIDHAERTGDIGPSNRLYLALCKGHRRSALTAWYLAHAKLAANTDKDTKKEKPFNFDKTKTTDMEMAAAKPWHTFKPDPEPDQVFDVVKALHALLARASKANSVSGVDLLVTVKNAVAEFDAVHPNAAAAAKTAVAAGDTTETTAADATTDKPGKRTTAKGKAAQKEAGAVALH